MTFDNLNRVALAEVAIGVVGGVAVRWSLGELLATIAALVVVNFLGCVVLGAAVHRTRSATMGRLVGIGFCGGLTTMSGAAVEVAERFDAGKWSSGGGVGLLVLLAAASGFGVGSTCASHWARSRV